MHDGLAILQELPAGTHGCLFYRRWQDAIEALAPYFRSGLEQNELCVWASSEPDAGAALARELRSLEGYLRSGQMEIERAGPPFQADRMPELLERASRRGFSGLRVSGDTAWVEEGDWQAVNHYEAALDALVRRSPMRALCTYSQACCGPAEILDVLSNHAFALGERCGEWQVLGHPEGSRIAALPGVVCEHLLCPDGAVRFLYLSEQAADLFEVPAQDLLRDPGLFQAMLHPADLAGLREAASAALREQTPLTAEARIRTPSGRVKRIRIVSRPHPSRPGVWAGILMEAGDRDGLPQESYREIVETAQEGIVISAPSGPFVFANRRMAEMLGYTREEIVGRSGLDFLDGEHRDQVPRLREVLGAGGTVHGEYKFRRKDGSVLWTLATSFPLYDHAGAHVGDVGMHTDITARKQAEQLQRTSEDRVRNLFEFSPTAMALMDLEGVFLDCNQAALLLHGLDSKDELLGKRCFSLIEESCRELAAEKWREVIGTGSVRDLELVLLRGDGARIDVVLSAGLLRDAAGQPYAVLAMVQDVTERARIAQALRDSQADLARAQAVSRTGNWRIDLQGQLLWSDQSYRIFGIPPGTPMDYERFLAAVHPEDRTHVDESWTAALGGAPYDIEHRILAAGRLKWVREKAELEFDAQGRLRGAFGTVTDITDRKLADEALRKSQATLHAMAFCSPDPIFLKDRSGRMLLANPATLAVIGKPAEEVLGRTDEEFYDDHELGRRILETDQRIMASGRAEVVEETVIGPAGRRTYLSTKAPYRDSEGRVIGLIGVARDITGRLETEKKYHSLFETTSDGVWIDDLDGRLTEVNDAYCRMSGYSRDELIGMTIPQLEAAETPAEVAAHIRRVVERGGHDRFESRHRRKDGSIYDVDITALYMNVQGGRLAIFVRDITARKAVEKALAEARDLAEAQAAQLKAVLDNLAEGVAIFDPQGRLLMVNSAAQRLFELPSPGGGPQSWAEYTAGLERRHLDGRPMAVEEWPAGRVVRGETFTDDELIVRNRASGAERWASASGVPVRDENGGLRFALVTIRDITGRKQAEEALRRSEALYRAIACAIPDGAVWVVDQDLRYLVVEGCLAALLGAPRERAEGCLVAEVFEGELRATVEQRFRRALAGDSASYETEHAGRTVWSQYVPLRDDAARVVAAMALTLDITERKRHELQLQQAQKLESIGLLAGGIAHDFNNLLVGVIGNASLAQDMLPYGSPAGEALGRIVRAGEQAAQLTRQMLAYAGKGRFRVEPVDLSAVVEEAVPLFQSSISKRIAVHLELERGLPAVESDPTQMQQIFMNLALNAAEAIGSGPGVVSVLTGALTVEAAYIRQELTGWTVEPGCYAYLEVRDTGCGMEAATRDRIFDPFFTTKFQGRGLGLAAVAGIVRAHRGAIALRTAPGAGATFRVLIPALPAGRAAAAAPVEASGDLRGKGTVLFIDDEQIVRDLARNSLERHGYEVLLAEHGAAALDVLRQAAGRVALAVLDLSMPGLSGEETLSRLRQIQPGLPVVVSSGYSETETLRLFGGAPLSGFLQKPYTVQELARTVKGVLGSAR